MKTTRIIGCAVAIIIVTAVLIRILVFSSQKPEKVELRIAGVNRLTNGIMHVRLVLTNHTGRVFHVVDDSNLKPIFLVEDAKGAWSWPTNMANTLKVNLNPGGELTRDVWLTNPPIRFRFRCVLRDLIEEGSFVRRWTDKARRMFRREEPPGPLKHDIPHPVSEWVTE